MKNDVINEVFSSLCSRRLSISLNTNVYLVESFSSELGKIIWLKCVVYLDAYHPHKNGCPSHAS